MITRPAINGLEFAPPSLMCPSPLPISARSCGFKTELSLLVSCTVLCVGLCLSWSIPALVCSACDSPLQLQSLAFHLAGIPWQSTQKPLVVFLETQTFSNCRPYERSWLAGWNNSCKSIMSPLTLQAFDYGLFSWVAVGDDVQRQHETR